MNPTNSRNKTIYKEYLKRKATGEVDIEIFDQLANIEWYVKNQRCFLSPETLKKIVLPFKQKRRRSAIKQNIAK